MITGSLKHKVQLQNYQNLFHTQDSKLLHGTAFNLVFFLHRFIYQLQGQSMFDRTEKLRMSLPWFGRWIYLIWEDRRLQFKKLSSDLLRSQNMIPNKNWKTRIVTQSENETVWFSNHLLGNSTSPPPQKMRKILKNHRGIMMSGRDPFGRCQQGKIRSGRGFFGTKSRGVERAGGEIQTR